MQEYSTVRLDMPYDIIMSKSLIYTVSTQITVYFRGLKLTSNTEIPKDTIIEYIFKGYDLSSTTIEKL